MLECLQKALRIANSAIEEIVTVQLYCDTLDKYLYFLDRGAPAVRAFSPLCHTLLGHRPTDRVLIGHPQIREQPRGADHLQHRQRLLAGRAPVPAGAAGLARGGPNTRDDHPPLPKYARLYPSEEARGRGRPGGCALERRGRRRRVAQDGHRAVRGIKQHF